MSFSAEVGRSRRDAVPVARPVFLRLAVSTIDPSSQSPMGIFQVAHRLRRYSRLDAASAAAIDRELAWFERHLAEPQRLVDTSAKGFYRGEPVGVTWLRPEAVEHVAHAHALARALADCGVPVQTLHTEQPGYVVYEDEHQVVAVPFRDR